MRAVVFDAVGTLLAPDPPPATVYADVGRRFGCRQSADDLRPRFRAAFRRQEEADRTAGHRTDEAREVQRWRAIVTDCLDDVTDREGCFRALWDHFARPDAWRCNSAAATVLAELSRRGFALGIASNFDGRLRTVVAGRPELAAVQFLVVSSEVGWRKPAPAFFDAVVRAAGCAADEVLLIGDDLENDYQGATAAGLRALLLDPQGAAAPDMARITSLGELCLQPPQQEAVLEQSLDEWLDEYDRLNAALRPYLVRITHNATDPNAPQESREPAEVFRSLHYYWSAGLVNNWDVFGYVPFIIDHEADFVAIGAKGTLQALAGLMPYYREQQGLKDDIEKGEYWWRTQEERASVEALAEGVHEFARLLLAYAKENLPVHDDA